MGSVAFIGRLMVAFLFLTSGAQKLSSFNLSDGGPTMDLMVRRLLTQADACEVQLRSTSIDKHGTDMVHLRT